MRSMVRKFATQPLVYGGAVLVGMRELVALRRSQALRGRRTD